MPEESMHSKVGLFESVTCHCTSAEEFLKKLDPTQDCWWEDRPWIFRGQNDAKWELIPSLFRHWKPEYKGTYELRLVDNFVQNVNLMSLPIPNNALNYYSYWRD